MRRDDWLIHQLPVGMAEDDFLVRFLTIFQNVADTVVHQIDALPHVFDPTVAPTPMVRAMAQWIGVDWVDSSLDDRIQRAIVIEYAQLIQWRGTKRGLRRLLRLLSGGADVEVLDSGGVFGEGEAPVVPPHVRLEMASPGWNRVEDLVRIVRHELPASVTFDLWIAGERVWPRPERVSHVASSVSATLAPGSLSENGDG
jgi:phage tail-like protein